LLGFIWFYLVESRLINGLSRFQAIKSRPISGFAQNVSNNFLSLGHHDIPGNGKCLTDISELRNMFLQGGWGALAA
jgi:hypothetical protein